ncbi:MAG: VOC family protein [Patulibacter minatonensis]
MPERQIFISLPVASVAASRAFFEALGFAFDDRFADETTACMVVNEGAFFMLAEPSKFAALAPREVLAGDAGSAHLFAFSCESREAVDAAIDAVVAGGGQPVGEDEDYGFMYGRGFYDLDGHGWSAMWMDPSAAAGQPEGDAVQA